MDRIGQVVPVCQACGPVKARLSIVERLFAGTMRLADTFKD